MAGDGKQKLSQRVDTKWVDTIDMHSDGIADSTVPEGLLKKALKKDLGVLWERKTEGRITDAEYNQYVNAAKVIFEKGGTRTHDIRVEYEKEKTAILRRTNTYLENISLDITNNARKVRNVATDAYFGLEQKLISEDTVQAFNNEDGNYLIHIKDFEQQLKTQSLENINGLAMRNYFNYLQSRGKLNEVMLEEKCGSKERLLQLAVIWGAVLEGASKARESFSGDNKGGGIIKLRASTLSKITGGAESDAEKILKKVILTNIKGTDIENRLIERQKKSKNLESEGYEAIIESLSAELMREFGGKQPTGDMIRAFFGKKEAQEAQEAKKLETRQEKEIKNKTVGGYLKMAQISPDSFINPLIEKDISTLTVAEKKHFLSILSSVDTLRLPQEIRTFIETEKEIKNKKEKSNFFEKISHNGPSGEIIAQNLRHKKSPEELSQSIIPTFSRIKNKQQIEDRDYLYRNTLSQIGYSSVSELLGNTNPLSQTLLSLEEKGLRDSQLYKDLKIYQQTDGQLRKKEAREYIKAIENISETELQFQEKKGRTIQGSAEELYREDVKQKKTTDFTVSQEGGDKKKGEKAGYPLFTGSFSVEALANSISSLKSEGQSVDFSTGKEIVRVMRTGIGFDISNTKDSGELLTSCVKQSEVENYIESMKFIDSIGCGFMMSGIDKILDSVKMKNPSGFNMKKGLSDAEKIVIMKTMVHIFNPEPIILIKGVLSEDLQKIRTHLVPPRDGSFRIEAGKKLLFKDEQFQFNAFIKMIDSLYA